MESLAERLSYKRTGGSKDHHKEHRLSKSYIGQPIKLEGNGKLSDLSDMSDNPGPSLMMKCVVVQRDEKGYGLTVSGDKPVYIQSVKEDGAAARAGVLQGDRIIKVNGSSVTDLNHLEVVKLIKGDTYVALTLLGPPSTSSSGATSSVEVSKSSNQQNPSDHVSKHNFYDEKVETIKKMLDQETAEFEKIKDEYASNPDPKILKSLGSAQKLMQDLRKQLWKAESMREKSEESPPDTAGSSTTDPEDASKPTEPSSEDQVALIDMDYCDPSEVVERPSNSEAMKSRRSQILNEASPEAISDSAPLSSMGLKEDTTTMDLLNEFQPDNPFKISEDAKAPTQQQNVQIMNFEDDDIVADNDAFQDHGPFNDWEKLRQRPAHLAVFFNYVLASHNPSNFLLSVSVDNYKQLSSSKDMVKHGDAIYKTYLAPNAVFRVAVDEGISRSIQSALSAKSPSEDTLRGVFDPAVQVASTEIRNQLSLYRMKREQGLGSLFGDEKLQHAINLDQQSDIRIVDEIIMPTLSDLLQTTGSDDLEQSRISVKQESLQSFLNQYGTKRTKAKTSRIYSILRSSKPQQLARGNRGLGSVDSILEEQNSKKNSGISGILKRRRVDSNAVEKLKSHERSLNGSRRDKTKNTFWENPPGMQGALLKPTKVGTSASPDHPSSATPLTVVDGPNFPQLRRNERSSESTFYPGSSVKEARGARPKSMPVDDGHASEVANPVPAQSPPQILESILHDSENYGNSFMANQESESTVDNTDTLSVDKKSKPSRTGSFRRRRDDEKRHSNSHQSHSDPDKTTIEQAVFQHNSFNDQLEQVSRHHTLSTTDSTLSLNVEERKIIEQLPNFAEDDEIDVDASEQHWSENVPKSVTRELDKKEIKRQQIINELIYTEQHHVRDLKILEKLFYEPLAVENMLSVDELHQAFPNLKEILNLHRELNKALQEQKEQDGYVVKEIGDILLSRFDGDGGNTFKEECAIYCGNQSTVLSLIKEKAKKDQKFNHFLQAVQRHQVCRKLHLKDFVPMEFQRLTKYPLLLENIVKHTKSKSKKQEAEIEKLNKACNRCRDILAFVNQTVKEAEDRQKILEIQQNLDREPILKLKHPSSVTNEFKHIDLVERPSILQGPLTFKIGQMDKRKQLGIHCILYDDVLVLLQKQDDKYVLKCYGTQGDKSSGGSHSPFVSMHNVLIRNVATDKRAFFVMSTSDTGPQMYEFVASTTGAKKQWMELISETAKKKESSTPLSVRRKAIVIPNPPRNENDVQSDEDLEKQTPAGQVVGRGVDNHPHAIQTSSSVNEFVSSSSSTSPYSDSDSLLLDKIQATHQEIADALVTKCKYLAEMSGLDQQEMDSILDMSAVDTEPEPSILIKHSIVCVDKLTVLLNDCATPENTFLKGRTGSSQDQSSSNRLSVELTETGYQSDNGTNPPEKWADPVTHPHHQSTSSDAPSSPFEETATTLNSVSDLPLSESDPTLSEGDMSPMKQHSDDGAAEASEGEQFFDTVEPAADNDAEQSDNCTKNKDSTTSSTSTLVVPDDSASEASKSRPSSGIDLCAHAGIVPINRMMDIVISLQTQLTQLMHVTEESESDRQRLRAENLQLRDELQKMENDPPAYEAEVQDDDHAHTTMTSPDTSNMFMASLARDVAFIRTSHRSCPDDVGASDDISPNPVNYKRIARRSTGF